MITATCVLNKLLFFNDQNNKIFFGYYLFDNIGSCLHSVQLLTCWSVHLTCTVLQACIFVTIMLSAICDSGLDCVQHNCTAYDQEFITESI